LQINEIHYSLECFCKEVLAGSLHILDLIWALLFYERN